MSLAARLATALVCGAAVGLAYPPYGWWPLLLPGLVGALAVLDGRRPRDGAVLGLAFGLTYMAVMLPWVQVIGPDAWIALTVLEALFYGVFGWAATWVRPYPWWPLATAGLWAAVELARSTVPFTGFPWGKIAFALADTPVEGFVRYLGVPGLGALLVGCAAVAWWGVQRCRDAPGSHAVPVPAVAAATAAWAGVAAVLALGALVPVGLAGPVATGGGVRVAAVQGGIPGDGADGLDEQREVVDNHARATEEYAAAVEAGTADPADVLFWPENSTDIDPLSDPETYARIDDAVDAVGVPVLVGALLAGPEPGTLQNAGLVWSPSTGPGDVYVKVNLVPFGEFIPMRDLLAPLVSRLDEVPRDFVAGDQPGVLDLGPVVVGDAMCYDVAFEQVAAPAVAGGAEMLVVQTNNATYRDSGQPAQQWAISRLRALETGRDLVVASTNGISGIVRADGTVVAKSTTRGAQVLTGTVQRATGITPAVRFGAWVERGLVGVGVLGLLVALGRAAVARSGRSGAHRPEAGPHREPVPSGTGGTGSA